MNSIRYKFWKKIHEWIHPVYTLEGKAKISFWTSGIHHVQFEGGNLIPDGCAFADKTQLGFRTTLGTNNYFGGKVSLGKYCQVGRDVAFHPTNHPISYLSTYINKQLFEGELKSLKSESPIEIGNDVWIGHGVIVLSGIKVGNGAILAAGSIITKDVPAYAIMAGNPAKVLRKRFSDSLIEELEELKWWDKNDEELEYLKPLFFKNLDGLNSLKI